MRKQLLLSLIVMALWGSLFPSVKIGYEAFGISSSSIPDILIFAAIRFVICGGLVCLFGLSRRKKMPIPTGKALIHILWIGFFSIVLHYACTYIGLSMTDSSKTALLKQSGALIYVCFAFLFFKDEKFSIYKIIGAIVGFCGIIAINISSGSVSFSIGDILILVASFSTVISNVISRKMTQSTSSLWITGIPQFTGGIVMLIVALMLKGTIPQINIKGVLVFAYICVSSTVAYVLWYYILRTTELSKMFIIKFAEPLFACLFGAVLLGENILKFQYLVAFILISAGIMLGHHNNEKNK